MVSSVSQLVFQINSKNSCQAYHIRRQENTADMHWDKTHTQTNQEHQWRMKLWKDIWSTSQHSQLVIIRLVQSYSQWTSVIQQEKKTLTHNTLCVEKHITSTTHTQTPASNHNHSCNHWHSVHVFRVLCNCVFNCS